MNRLVHSRILVSLLAVLLQVSLVPDPGRLLCMVRSGFFSCCCAHDEAPSPPSDRESGHESSCCDHHDDAVVETPAGNSAGEVSNDSGHGSGGGEACSCGSGVTVPPATPTPGGDDEHKSKKEAHGSIVPRVALDFDGPAVAKRVALRAVPRAPTGPPLHILFQVFLI